MTHGKAKGASQPKRQAPACGSCGRSVPRRLTARTANDETAHVHATRPNAERDNAPGAISNRDFLVNQNRRAESRGDPRQCRHLCAHAPRATGPRRDGGTALGGSAINLLRVDLFFTHVNVRCVNPPYRHPPPPT